MSNDYGEIVWKGLDSDQAAADAWDPARAPAATNTDGVPTSLSPDYGATAGAGANSPYADMFDHGGLGPKTAEPTDCEPNTMGTGTATSGPGGPNDGPTIRDVGQLRDDYVPTGAPPIPIPIPETTTGHSDNLPLAAGMPSSEDLHRAGESPLARYQREEAARNAEYRERARQDERDYAAHRRAMEREYGVRDIYAPAAGRS
jgi:hypothetical protein